MQKQFLMNFSKMGTHILILPPRCIEFSRREGFVAEVAVCRLSCCHQAAVEVEDAATDEC